MQVKSITLYLSPSEVVKAVQPSIAKAIESFGVPKSIDTHNADMTVTVEVIQPVSQEVQVT
jgi:hypothetical protein